MATKLFKIGESSYYGKWRITIKGDNITVQGIDFKTNEVQEETSFTASEAEDLERLLTEVSTSYHADKMMEFVKKHINIPRKSYNMW